MIGSLPWVTQVRDSLRRAAAERAVILSRAATAAFAVIAAASFVLILYLGRHLTFFGDEWYFIHVDGLGSFDDWMRPWGAHWSMIPMILWKAVFAVVGFGSYLPYLALVLTAHVVAAAAIFVLARRTSGPVIALCLTTIFLLLGSAHQNLFFSFQIGLVGSTAFGLWAFVAFDSDDRRSWAVGAILLALSVMSSGIGPAFVAGSALLFAAQRNRWQGVLWVVPAAALFVAWYAVWGRTGAADVESSTGTSDPRTIVSFLVLAPPRALEAIAPLGPVGAWILWICAVVAALAQRARGTLHSVAIGAAAGLATLIVLITIGRGELGVSYVAGQPRYVYEEAAFGFLIVSALLGRRFTRLPSSPAGGALALALLLLAVGVLWRNVNILPGGARQFGEQAGVTRALVSLIDRYGVDRLETPPPRPRFLTFLPDARLLAHYMDRWGRLDRDVIRQAWIPSVTPQQRDRALWLAAGGELLPVDAAAPSNASGPPSIIDSSGPGITSHASCLIVAGPGVVTVRVDESIVVRGPGEWTIGLGRDATPQAIDTFATPIRDGWHRISVPALGDGSSFRVLLRVPPGTSEVCTP